MEKPIISVVSILLNLFYQIWLKKSTKKCCGTSILANIFISMSIGILFLDNQILLKRYIQNLPSFYLYFSEFIICNLLLIFGKDFIWCQIETLIGYIFKSILTANDDGEKFYQEMNGDLIISLILIGFSIWIFFSIVFVTKLHLKSYALLQECYAYPFKLICNQKIVENQKPVILKSILFRKKQ